MDFSTFVPKDQSSTISFLEDSKKARFFCFDRTYRVVVLVLYEHHPQSPENISREIVIWPADGFISALDSKEAMSEFSLEWCAENVFPMSHPLWEEIKLTLEMSLL